jgi:PKD repeat protein
MRHKNSLMKPITLLCILLLTLFILGCNGGGGSDSNDSTQINVTANKTEGIAPLTVSFDISGIDEADINSIYWEFGDGTAQSSSYLSDDYDASHTYTTAGPFTVTAYVSTWSDGTYTGLARVKVFPDVNLVVSSFAIDDQIGTETSSCDPEGETISAIIQNVGDMSLEGTGNIRVAYYLSEDEMITVDDIYIGDTTIVVGDYFIQGEVPFGFELLSPLENYQYIHKIYVKCNIPSRHDYYVGAIVDYLDQYHWYDFPRLTDTEEIFYPCPLFDPAECNSIIWETNENDNSRVLLGHKVTVNNGVCVDDAYEESNDDSSNTQNQIFPGDTQPHNFCYDNADWVKFDAIKGNVYGIYTSIIGSEVDTQLILYDRDGNSILLFQDNEGDYPTVDLGDGWPVKANSEIVWEAEFSGTYFIKVRSTTCDEDIDPHCLISPDGVGLNTEYTITLEEY